MANNAPGERYKVVYKRPTDLALGKDVPVCCNIVLCDMLDEGGPCPRTAALLTADSCLDDQQGRKIPGRAHVPACTWQLHSHGGSSYAHVAATPGYILNLHSGRASMPCRSAMQQGVCTSQSCLVQGRCPARGSSSGGVARAAGARVACVQGCSPPASCLR